MKLYSTRPHLRVVAKTTQLKVSSEALETAKSNKCVGYIEMNPLDFIKLTVSGSVFAWLDQEKEYTKTLDEYNSYNSRLMPWLDVDIHSGKVVGHEGRHRAAAVYYAGGKEYPVAICLREKGYPLYYRTPYAHEGYSSPRVLDKVYVTKDDVPKVLKGQFSSSSVVINPSRMHEFWASYNK